MKGKKILSAVRKRIAEVILSTIGLVFCGMFVYHISLPEKKEIPPPKYTIPYPNADLVDSTFMAGMRLHMLLQEMNTISAKSERDNTETYGLLVTAIVTLSVAGLKISQTNNNRENKRDHEKIFVLLEDVLDTRIKKNLVEDLRNVGIDRMTLLTSVINPDVKVLIDGICYRVCRFFVDSATKNLNQELYEHLMTRIDTNVMESQIQLRSLSFSKEYMNSFTAIQKKFITVLKGELRSLKEDEIDNNKYERFHSIIHRFLRSYLSEVVVLSLKIYGALGNSIDDNSLKTEVI